MPRKKKGNHKWGAIGAPHSAKRKAHMRKIAKKAHRRDR